MAQRTKKGSDDQKEGFLSRWSARKSEVTRGNIVPGDPVGGLDTEPDATTLEYEEAHLSDDELLKKYDLPNPATIEDETALDRFFSGDMPERLRQMALRRLWRLNPLFAVVDDMVEYGEDYTDAATVIDGMQTAYSAGKGYLNHQSGEAEAETTADAAEDAAIAEPEAVEGSPTDEAAMSDDNADRDSATETLSDTNIRPVDQAASSSLPRQENADGLPPMTQPDPVSAYDVPLADSQSDDENLSRRDQPVIQRPQRMIFAKKPG